MRIGTARLRVVAAMCATLAGWIGGARAQAPPGWKAVVRIRPNPIPLGRCTNLEIEMQDPDGFRTGLLSNGQAMNQRQFTFTSSDNTSFSWRGVPADGVICATAGVPPATTTIRVAFPDGVIGEVQLTSVAPGTSVTPVLYPPQARLRPPGFVSRAPVVAVPLTAVTGMTTGVSIAPPASASAASLPTPHSLAAPVKHSPVSATAFVPATVAVTASPIAGIGPYYVPSSPALTASAIQAVGPFFIPTAIAISSSPITAVGPYFVPSSPAITADPIRAIGPGSSPHL